MGGRSGKRFRFTLCSGKSSSEGREQGARILCCRWGRVICFSRGLIGSLSSDFLFGWGCGRWGGVELGGVWGSLGFGGANERYFTVTGWRASMSSFHLWLC